MLRVSWWALERMDSEKISEAEIPARRSAVWVKDTRA